MVATQINVGAIQAELQSIAALMAEIGRMTGPQTWQGGSAGAFTTDLQGHNRSLDRMAHTVLETAANSSPQPITITPPPMPRVPLALGAPGVSAVSPRGLERLETSLRRAADGLPARAARIRALLPTPASTTQCDRTAAWCQAQAARTRTRIRYALAENQTNPLGGQLSSIPDMERFGSKEMAELGRLQGLAFGRHLDNPTAYTPELLAEIGRTLRENAKNADYTSTFFNTAPPGSSGKLAHHLHLRQGGPLTTGDKRLVGDFGTALAALSRRQEGRAAVSRALGPIGADLPGQALLVKLSAPEVKWGSAVLLDLGRAALRWRQKYPSYAIAGQPSVGTHGQPRVPANRPANWWWNDWGLGQGMSGGPDNKTLREYDPALNILSRIAAQNDTTAARELVATQLEHAFTIKDAEKAKAITWVSRSQGDTYAALLVSPDWLDGGTAAGAVIRLATTPEKGHEQQAAQNAAAVMKTVAWWNAAAREKLSAHLKEGGPPDVLNWHSMDRAPDWFAHSDQYAADLGPGMRSGLLQMTRMHLPALADANRTSAGSNLPNTDRATGRVYVDISGDEMEQFLRTLAADDKAWTQLAVDAQAYRQQLYAWGLRTGLIRDATARSGYLEGILIAAYTKERFTREEITQRHYQDAQKQLGVLRDVGATLLTATPPGQVTGVGDAYGATTDLALSKVEHTAFNKRVEEIKAKGSRYSDQFYIDLARGHAQSQNGHTGDRNVDSLLHKQSLSEDELSYLVKWTRDKVFEGGEKQRWEVTGRSIVRDSEGGVEHNSPNP